MTDVDVGSGVGDMVIYFLDGLAAIVFVGLIVALAVCYMKYRRNKQSMEDVEHAAIDISDDDDNTKTKENKKFIQIVSGERPEYQVLL